MVSYILIALCIVIIVLLIMLLARGSKPADTGALTEEYRQESSRLRSEINTLVNSSVKSIGDVVFNNQKEIGHMQSEKLTALEKRFEALERSNVQSMEQMRKTVEDRVSAIQKDNNAQLEKIRVVVDEKLQKTLDAKMTESFKLVTERLQQVYEGLGEMKNLAAGVGDLKKVLSNVKTRGILGEIQLGAILEEILSPEQYDVNVQTIPGSKNFVEYAIKLPADDGRHVYLPIDSKFPADSYHALCDAYESGDSDAVKAASAELVSRIKAFAKDIKTKYIEVPYTTDFGVMFLPFEGLYAEAVKLGLVETLQTSYKVNIAGPSTMAAFLNSLQMGFRTLALQKRSAQVWDILGAVKTEFDKFGSVLTKTQERLNQINGDLDKLVGTRTNAIIRKLRDVERLDENTSAALLGAPFGDTDEE